MCDTKLFYLDWAVSVKHSVTVLPICFQLVCVLGRRVPWEAEFEFFWMLHIWLLVTPSVSDSEMLKEKSEIPHSDSY